jgi:putative DNA primase/helicase
VSSSTKRRACPACNRAKKDTALAVTQDERGSVSYCHRCGYTESNNHISAGGIVAARKFYRAWHELAKHLWETSEPLAGSLADRYLISRGCRQPPANGDLRFLPARGDYPAAMLARVSDAITAEPISLHFTHLNADGSKAGNDPRRLLGGHRKAGGVVMLWPNECVTTGLAIAEGIETALCAAHGFAPIWSTIDAGNMASFPLLAGIDALTIFADNDPTGISASMSCAKRWALVAEVTVVRPLEPGYDMADLVAA